MYFIKNAVYENHITLNFTLSKVSDNEYLFDMANNILINLIIYQNPINYELRILKNNRFIQRSFKTLGWIIHFLIENDISPYILKEIFPMEDVINNQDLYLFSNSKKEIIFQSYIYEFKIYKFLKRIMIEYIKINNNNSFGNICKISFKTNKEIKNFLRKNTLFNKKSILQLMKYIKNLES